MRVNDMGEFTWESGFDPDANRERAYGSIARIDPSKLAEKGPLKRKPHMRKCKRCGGEFLSDRGRRYCDGCRDKVRKERRMERLLEVAEERSRRWNR